MPADNSAATPTPQEPVAGASTTDRGTTPETTQAPDTRSPSDTPDLFKEEQDAGEGDNAGGNEDKSGDNAPEEESKPADAPLTAEDITIPEGFTYDKELGDSFLSIVNDSSLSRREMVQKLTDLHAAQMSKFMASLQAAEAENLKTFEAEMAKEKADWMKQCQADAEFGGQAWEASQAVIDRGCKQVATPGAIAVLQRYNLNTHPEIVRMFYRSGKLAGEDRSPNGGGGRIPDPAEAIFGESLKNWKSRGEMKDG